MTEQQEQSAAGWYEQDGGLRFFDGNVWTDLRAPKPPAGLTQRQIASAVLVGVLAAFFVVWGAAQLAPDTFYVPVKFVVKEIPHF